jgi:hypothetical protein
MFRKGCELCYAVTCQAEDGIDTPANQALDTNTSATVTVKMPSGILSWLQFADEHMEALVRIATTVSLHIEPQRARLPGLTATPLALSQKQVVTTLVWPATTRFI